MKGIIGKFFFQFGVTISVAVLISLLEALTLAPMRCSRFLEVGKRGKMGRQVDFAFVRLSATYLRWLKPALHHRGWVMLGAVAFFVASLGIVRFLRSEFIPSQGGGFPVEFNIRGRDWDTLARSTRQIMDEMRQGGVVTDVDSDYQVGMPEVQVVPNRNKAADLGVSMATIGETVNSAIGGLRMGKFKDKGRRFDIRGRLLAPQRQRPEGIQRLLVRAGDGSLVRLGDIVTIG